MRPWCSSRSTRTCAASSRASSARRVPNQEGRFRLSALPPGEYLAIAVQGLEDGQASDPEFLAAVEDQAIRVTIEDGETKSVTLGLSQVPR